MYKDKDKDKDKEKNKTLVSAGLNAGAALFATLVVVSMFMTYVSVDLLLLKTNITGFKLLDYEGAVGKSFLIISIILSAAILAFSILRLIRFPLFNTRLFCMIYALAGLALLAVSIVLMVTVVQFKIAGITTEVLDRGIGVILNLVFSILVAIFCIGSVITTRRA